MREGFGEEHQKLERIVKGLVISVAQLTEELKDLRDRVDALEDVTPPSVEVTRP